MEVTMEVDKDVVRMANERDVSRGVIATADTGGKPDVAYFGSLRFTDTSTMQMVTGPTRTLTNLKANPHAVFMVSEGKDFQELSGWRVHLEVRAMIESGDLFEKARAEVAKRVGDEAARTMKAIVTFDVADVRPLREPRK